MFSKALTFTLLALSGLTSTMASPLTKRGVAPNTQSCTVTDEPGFNSYSIDIGVAYNGGVGCDDVLHSIQSRGIAITNWQCVDDGAGNTQLWFNTPIDPQGGYGSAISYALSSQYPTVNGFNCPDY